MWCPLCLAHHLGPRSDRDAPSRCDARRRRFTVVRRHQLADHHGHLPVSSPATRLFRAAFIADSSIRTLIGFGCGMSGVSVPLFLTELCPKYAQALGIANQLCFVSGLIAAQALGLPFNSMMEWRWIMVVAAGLAGFMAVFSLFAVSPDSDSDDKQPGEQTALLREKKRDMSMKELLKSKDTTISTGCE